MTVDKHETATSWDELPATITTYLTARRERDVSHRGHERSPTTRSLTDEGHASGGRDDNRRMSYGMQTESFTFTTEFVGATTPDAASRRRATPGRGLSGWGRRPALPVHHGWHIVSRLVIEP